YWIGVIASFAILIQLHYLTLLSGAAAGVLWLIQLIRIFKKKKRKGIEPQGKPWTEYSKTSRGALDHKILVKNKSLKKVCENIWPLLKPALIGLTIFIISLIPLLLFDLKHDQLNLKAFSSLLGSDQNFSQHEANNIFKKITDIFQETEGRAMHILLEYNLGQNRQLNRALVGLSLVTFALSWFAAKKQKVKNSHLVIFVYLATGILGTATYQHTIFNHYIAYLFPITSLVYAIALSRIIKSKFNKIGILLAGIFLAWFVSYNIPLLPLKPDYLMKRVEQTAKVLVSNLQDDEKYNIVLLSESKDHYGQAYRYFLQTSDQPPLAIGDYDQIETLVVIDEFKKPNQAIKTNIYDLVVFPEKNIDQQIEVSNGPNLYYLRIDNSNN
ncbi:MAG: hypothetical protein U9O78_02385, partial [Patescibacteria group bacterium]|nr:hypothetical protein [Patescibacteria group bacterium]